jgi:uncharacterized membrane protein YgdD (TMEM256/DUF423 family)
MASDALATVALFTVSAAVTALPQFLPKISEVHATMPGTADAADLRVGEAVASGFLVVVGLSASAIVGNSDPLFASVVIAGFLVLAYEAALRGFYFERAGCGE